MTLRKLSPIPGTIAGLLILGTRPLDAPHSYFQWLGLLLIAGSFLATLFHWGAWIASRLTKFESSPQLVFLALGAGSLFLALWIAALTAVPSLVQAKFRFLWLAIFYGGLFLKVPAWPSRKSLVTLFKSKPGFEKFLISLLALAILTRFVFASRFHPHGDPFIYHLTAVRTWYDTGSFERFLDNPALFHASYWEYFLQWINFFVASAPGIGLEWGQIFGQWMHVLVGWIGCGAALVYFLQKLEFKGPIVWIATLAALSNYPMEWTTHLAKNDWGVSLWWFLGTYMLFVARRPAIGGFIFGVVFFTKMTVLFALFPTAIVWVAAEIKRKTLPRDLARHVVFGLSAFVLALLPIAIRNFVWTQNPFFPTLSTIFPSPLMATTFAESVNVHGANILHLGNLTRFGDFITLAPLSALAPLSFVYFLVSRKHRFVGLCFVGFCVVAYSLFFIKTSPDAEFRWLEIANVVATAGFAAGALNFFHERLSLKASAITLVLLALMALVSAKVPFFAYAQFNSRKFPLPEEAVLKMRNGAMKKWIRLNLAPEKAIVMGHDNELYYIAHHRAWTTYYVPKIDSIMRTSQNIHELLTGLQRAGAEYYLIGRPEELIPPNSPDAWVLDQTKRFPKVVAHAEEQTYLVDLNRLKEKLNP